MLGTKTSPYTAPKHAGTSPIHLHTPPLLILEPGRTFSVFLELWANHYERIVEGLDHKGAVTFVSRIDGTPRVIIYEAFESWGGKTSRVKDEWRRATQWKGTKATPRVAKLLQKIIRYHSNATESVTARRLQARLASAGRGR